MNSAGPGRPDTSIYFLERPRVLSATQLAINTSNRGPGPGLIGGRAREQKYDFIVTVYGAIIVGVGQNTKWQRFYYL